MGYAEQQRQPGKHLTGIAVVIIFHLILGYALATGLASNIVKIIKPVMETTIIEEVKKPPPPPEPPPPPPKMVQVMPTFVPPPEVQIQAPQIQAPVIANTSPVAPTTFVPPSPPAPPTQVTSTAPPAVGVVCPNSRQIQADIKFPTQARRDGLQGDVLLEFTLAANGEVKDVDVKSSSNRVFNSVSINAVRQFKCNAQGRDIRVQVPFSFKLTD